MGATIVFGSAVFDTPATAAVVHLHADGLGDPVEGCRVVCGLPCGPRSTTAYRGLDPERVTCPACLNPSKEK